MSLSTSVVLTTYNGIKYLEPLVNSLRLQTKKIDEVIICDDGSKDETIAFLKNYIDNYRLAGWQIVVNEENKGWKKNFRDGILAATGDIVFPCDQDDVWDVQKIEKMTLAFENDENMLLLSSDYTPLYEDGGAKVDTFKEQSEVPKFVPDNEKFSVHTRPGCVMAIRKSFVKAVEEIWAANYAHDAFLWTAATLLAGNFLLNVPLIQYRRHDNNASTGAHRTISNQVELMEMGENIVNWYKNSNPTLSNEKNNMLDGFLQWVKLREELLLDKKITNFFKLIKYHAYFRSLRQELGDLYYLTK